MSIVWLERDALFPAVRVRLQPTDVVLDIGCGITPQDMVRPLVHICCEPHGGYLERLREIAKERCGLTYVIVQATWGEAIQLFPPGSVDTVFLVDVIEHLEKEEGRRLLAATERMARRQVAVFTPLGFMPQSHPDGKDAWGMDGAAWQEHRSGWDPEDFGVGWDVFASKAFHRSDNLGRPLAAPHGAFWAVKTIPSPEADRSPAARRREGIRAIHALAAGVEDPDLLEKIRAILETSVRLRRREILGPLSALMRLALRAKESRAVRALLGHPRRTHEGR